MTKHLWLVLVFCLWPPIPALPQAKTQPGGENGRNLRVSPESLGAVILGQTVELMTRDGTYVRGKVVRASAEAITVRMTKSEPAGRFHGPEPAIPTEEISAVHVRKNGSVAVPVAMGIFGAFAALWTAAYAAEDVHSTGAYIAIGLASATGGATGGALLGREVAKKTVTIDVSKH